MERMLSLVANKRIDVLPIISPVLYGFDQIPKALVQ